MEPRFGDRRFSRRNIIAGVVLLVIVVTILGWLVFDDPAKSSDRDPVLNMESKVRRFSDGVFVWEGEENSYPMAVMIENYHSVRPQKGLQSANVVYEALAEGGITRFMAIYASGKDLKEIGPIRSSRLYYLGWAEEYRGGYAHIGGSPEAQAEIGSYPLLNLDALRGDFEFFWRSNEVHAPHNLFTSTELLARWLRDKSAPEKGDFDPWKFKDDRPNEERGSPISPIHIDFSSQSYNVDYLYESVDNVYARVNGGEPHVDALNGKQILVKNVVIQFVESGLADATGRLKLGTSGTGRSLIFQDGLVAEGTWERKDVDRPRTRFYDTENKEIEFNAGPIWIEVVPNTRTVTY